MSNLYQITLRTGSNQGRPEWHREHQLYTGYDRYDAWRVYHKERADASPYGPPGHDISEVRMFLCEVDKDPEHWWTWDPDEGLWCNGKAIRTPQELEEVQ